MLPKVPLVARDRKMQSCNDGHMMGFQVFLGWRFLRNSGGALNPKPSSDAYTPSSDAWIHDLRSKVPLVARDRKMQSCSDGHMMGFQVFLGGDF